VINIANAYEDSRFNRAVDRATGYRTCSVLCMPVINKEGRKLGVMQVLNKRGGPFRRVDEQRLRAFSAQAAIALENAQLFEDVLNERNYNESILRSLTNGVITLDAGCNVIKANDAVLRILRWRRDEVVGRPLESIFTTPSNSWILDSLARVARTGEAELAMDAQLDLPGTAPAAVNVNIVPLIDVGDRAIGYMLVLEDITTEKRVKGTMARYMTKEVADRLLEGGDDLLGGQSQEATVLFSDIRGFTTISEQLGPRETVSMLNEYFTDMIEVIFSHRGILDKYIGDAIMALFGAPFPRDDDADNALFVADEMMRVLRRFNGKRRSEGKVTLDIGIGISTGELVAGNIGSPKRMDYTVIGDTVNLASRLESATKHYGVKVLYSEFTAEALQGEVFSREVDLIRVKGKSDPVVVYESLGHHDARSFPNMKRTLHAYRRGMKLYCDADWKRAAGAFREALGHNPDDALSRLYLDRCRHYEEIPPPPDWDGVWTMHTK
jgi:adenylate cyclase